MRQAVNELIKFTGFKISRRKPAKEKTSKPLNLYDQDSLRTAHNHEFMQETRFKQAYARGVASCDATHILHRGGAKHQIHWRVHVALWAASHARTLEGDFVECGVDRGIFSSAIMTYLDWNDMGKRFFLFDTFCGLDPELLSPKEIRKGRMEFSRSEYPECYERTRRNFAEFKNVHLVRGAVPGTLTEVDIKRVAYLAIDMNCAAPEIAAADYFWDKMSPGAPVLLDDYAYVGYQEQKEAFDEFAIRKGIKILSLPTGQGLMIKP